MISARECLSQWSHLQQKPVFLKTSWAINLEKNNKKGFSEKIYGEDFLQKSFGAKNAGRLDQDDKFVFVCSPT
jgi:hypothetical protein